MVFFVYLLESEKNGRYYIGQTQNMQQRLIRHNSGYEKSTKNFAPWRLVAHISCNSRSEAIKLETKIKRLKKRERQLQFFLNFDG